MPKLEKVRTRYKIPPAPMHPVKGLHDDWLLPVSKDLLMWGVEPDDVKEICYREGLASARSKGRSDDYWRTEVNNAVNPVVKWFLEHPNARASGNVTCGRYESRYLEIEEKIALAGGETGRSSRRKRYLPFSAEKRKLALRRHSCRHIDELVRQDVSLQDLFCGYDFNICLATKMTWPIIEPISFWQSINWKTRQFIVPSPMHECGAGTGSRLDKNVSRRMYQIIEFDTGTLDEQYQLLLWLNDEWSLAMIVYSGHRSLHGWFPCYPQDDRDTNEFFKLATVLGADRRMDVLGQYTRLPGGYNRKWKCRQHIVYLDYDLIQEHSWYVKEDMGDC